MRCGSELRAYWSRVCKLEASEALTNSFGYCHFNYLDDDESEREY
jgi:hypothetical protein